MQEWWQGSRLVAWSRRLAQWVRQTTPGSVTVRQARAWRRQWQAMGRVKVLRLFTWGGLFGFAAVLLAWGRALTPREVIIRAAVLVMAVVVVRRCAASAGK